jgi:CRISPR-associated protein Cas2
MFTVVSYDVPDDKRRLKMAKLLLDFGAVRVQCSVFECHLTDSHMERLRQRLARLHNAQEDNIRIYRLCEGCRPKAILIGSAQPTPEPGLLII